MKVGDLVWSLSHDKYDKTKIIERRLAIIKEVDHQWINPYVIQLVASGFEGRTAKKYLEPVEEL
tara:strand:+ start:50 stop:241 length:192 start_codon:yes stop_codon:yes gene_type:complete